MDQFIQQFITDNPGWTTLIILILATAVVEVANAISFIFRR